MKNSVISLPGKKTKIDIFFAQTYFCFTVEDGKKKVNLQQDKVFIWCMLFESKIGECGKKKNEGQGKIRIKFTP